MIMTYKKTGLLLAAVLLSSMFALANASDIFNGREVYEMHCQTCHGMDGRAMDPAAAAAGGSGSARCMRWRAGR